mgnify:CR=1 FL=1
MKKMVLLLCLLVASAIAPAAVNDIRAEMAAVDRAFIPVWALTVEGRLDLAAKAMMYLQREWYGFKERHYGDKPPDAGWRADFDRIDALIREADSILDGGRFPDLVRAPLERSATVLAALRQRNGIDYYVDRLTAYRVLVDGIGSIDVSNTSVDHAVVINPLLAERVEVLRGPSALLFGSSAVGGVVNVIDTRIPRSVPEKGYRLSGMASYGSAANERSGSAAVDVPVTDKVVFHLDGTYGKTDDLDTGNYILSRPLRRQYAST